MLNTGNNIMMKIGILTFHNSRNYGAVLQAYGLKEVLRIKGHQVEIIDYRCTAIDERKRPFTYRHFKSNPKKYLLLFLNVYFTYRTKVKNFSSFERNCLNVTKKQFTPNDIENADFDVIIVGSDQVWSPVITDGPDPVYWGAYRPVNSRLYAYGVSSSAIPTLETDQFRDVGQWLNRVNAISVREERLKEFVETHSNKKATVVADPTLLAGREIFEEITSPRLINQPYILLYTVEGSPSLNAIVKKVAALYNARIIRTGSNGLSNTFKDMQNGVTYKNASVEEMLSLIKYAECVVALSFHGTALSLLYEKDFFSVKGGNMARVESILSKCSLTNRIIDSPDQVTKDHIDYSNVTPILNEMKKDSLDWLDRVLNEGDKQ